MIKFNKVKGFTDLEAGKLQQALGLANQAIASDLFEDLVKEYVFTTTKDVPAEILQRIRQDWSIDISIVTPPFWRRLFSKEIAHECEDGSVVLDRNKFQEQDAASVAQTLAHETAHVAGYRHASAKDLTSAPYAVGILVEKVIRFKLKAYPNSFKEELAATKETNS